MVLLVTIGSFHVNWDVHVSHVRGNVAGTLAEAFLTAVGSPD